jgi:hypothetical protein
VQQPKADAPTALFFLAFFVGAFAAFFADFFTLEGFSLCPRKSDCSRRKAERIPQTSYLRTIGCSRIEGNAGHEDINKNIAPALATISKR